MKFDLKFAVLGTLICSCFTCCKKDDSPSQTVSFANQPLNTVLGAIKGRWRAVYYTGVSIAGYSQQPVADTSLGYYTWFYADHVTYANRAGDSVIRQVVWDRVAYDNDSLYAFVSPYDRTVLVGNGYAVFEVVNDTLSIGTVNHGIDYGAGILYKKD